MKNIDFESKSLNAVSKVELLIQTAISVRASDVHIDPLEGKNPKLVRMRIDGIIRPFTTLSHKSYQEIIARIKVVSRLRIDIQHLPQDGRFELDGSSIRVSTVPTLFGESLVMRVLNRSTKIPELSELGFDSVTCKILTECTSLPSGLLVVSGPTGSGKTTVLYSLMKIIGQSSRSIVTIEDPIERVLSFARQIPVRESLGLSFGTLLRTVLRQDPDVIVVGEIRDHETAVMAVSAAMTGHLVITTLHASCAAEIRGRLLSLGVLLEDYNSVHALSLSVRLVRTTCISCKDTNLTEEDHDLKCKECGGSGMKGRTAISEYIYYDQKSPTIYQNGLAKVESGVTTKAEIERIVAKDGRR